MTSTHTTQINLSKHHNNSPSQVTTKFGIKLLRVKFTLQRDEANFKETWNWYIYIPFFKVQTEEDEDDKRKLIFVVEDEKPVRKLAPLLSFYFSILRHNVYVHRGTQCLEKLNLVSFAGSCKFHPQSVSWF